MTIESTQSAQTMQGDGTRRVFPFTFAAWTHQLKVIITAPDGTETNVTALSLITVDGEAGGSVTYPADGAAPALPDGWKLTVMRDMNFKQETDLVTGGQYRSEVVEDRFDRLTAQDQQLLEAMGRTLQVPVASEETPDAFLQSLYEARAEAVDSAAWAAVSAANARESELLAVGAAAEARNAASRAESFKDAAQSARDTAIAQTEATNVLMAAEMGKINTIIQANRDDQHIAVEEARRWAITPHGVPVEEDAYGVPLYSALHYAEAASEIENPTMSPTRRGSARLGDDLELVENDKLRLNLDGSRLIRRENGGVDAPLAVAPAGAAPGVPGLAFPDGTSLAVSAGKLSARLIPVANGGTGQTTLAAARNAMGLGNTTGALPVANGGTGATTAAAARTALGITIPGSGFAPKPVTSAAVGQWRAVLAPSASATVLPAGGTWAYSSFYVTSGGNIQSVATSIAAGGTTVSASKGCNVMTLCWRLA